MDTGHKRAVRLAIISVFAAASIGLSATAHAECIGSFNTCFGDGALISNTTGSRNSAFGAEALEANTTARQNSAFGNKALEQNTVGENNTAVGYTSLLRNTTGSINTAVGALSMQLNTTGIGNTGLGFQALQLNTIGGDNTAVGAQALQVNETGERNTAVGSTALFQNESGSDNTASGSFALFSNTAGNTNTAFGANSLRNNTTGIRNTASGVGSLRNNTSGFRNVAIGYQAGFEVTGSDNIVIGGNNPGKATDNGVIRIGASANQNRTFIAGIRGVTTGSTSATNVFVDVNGQLGTIKSSREFKQDIHSMGNVSERLAALRPVTFRYKQAGEDGSKPMQFGLIAEEVAEAFPELVVYDDAGKPETVAYHLLPALLLNELQRAQRVNQQQTEQLAIQAVQLAEVNELKRQMDEMRSLLAVLQPGNQELQAAVH